MVVKVIGHDLQPSGSVEVSFGVASSQLGRIGYTYLRVIVSVSDFGKYPLGKEFNVVLEAV